MTALDPILAPALAMAERPVISSRRFAEEAAAAITTQLERLGAEMAAGARDPHQQLTHLTEALAVVVIGLCAYARGVAPQVGTQKPNVNVVVP
jgi:hypothetical protein